jgi:hypothetical protein
MTRPTGSDINLVYTFDIQRVERQNSFMSSSELPVQAFKAKLTVTLKANDVIVAEIEDANLWQQIVAAINGGKSRLPSNLGSAGPEGGAAGETVGTAEGSDNVNGKSVARLANRLAVDSAAIEGACSPSGDAPYLHLDVHCWEQMRSQLPKTGATAITPIAASATLLALWFREAGLGNATQSQAQAVLDTIRIRDQNPSRGIKNSDWLQSRAGGQIVLNPAAISKAVLLAKCFCSKSWKEWKETLAT